MLKEDNLFLHKGEINWFPRRPIDDRGIVGVNHGVRVEIFSHIIHMFCKFDKNRFGDAPKYTFAYQTRI